MSLRSIRCHFTLYSSTTLQIGKEGGPLYLVIIQLGVRSNYLSHRGGAESVL
jgi:hypothetical protein